MNVPEDDAETRFVAAVRNMLARPDYLIPLAAAERQFRDHYYGLNSAALLEDLFFDAVGSYLRQTTPAARWTRPPAGQKGWDYAFDGVEISHKVNQELGEVAALWDATKQGVTEWSFNEPIVYVLGKNSPSTGLQVSIADAPPIRCRAVADLGAPYVVGERALLIVRWPTHGSQPEVLEVRLGSKGQTASDLLPFDAIWEHVARHVSQGGAANEIDVLVTTAKPTRRTAEWAGGLDPVAADIAGGLRGGVYLLRRELLQNLLVTSNNRAILIPKDTIRDLLVRAVDRSLFAPLPLWYWPYAQERPPDMYSAQRAEYAARFSARGSDA